MTYLEIKDGEIVISKLAYRTRRLNNILYVCTSILLCSGGCCDDTLPSDIYPEFREKEANKMFTDYIAGRVLETREITIMDDVVIKVHVVESVAGADYGFVPIKTKLHNFWVTSPDYAIKRFDDHHLFVSFRY